MQQINPTKSKQIQGPRSLVSIIPAKRQGMQDPPWVLEEKKERRRKRKRKQDMHGNSNVVCPLHNLQYV
jgi:hypothetical protein